MFAIAARRLGYRIHVLSPDDDTPAGQVADREIRAAYDDLDAVADFARGVSVVTFEFENVPLAAAETVERHAPIRPHGSVLHTTQHRVREKRFLERVGVPLAKFAEIGSRDELHSAMARMGCPAVLKTSEWGYDGKGQAKIDSLGDVDTAWDSLANSSAVLEAFVDFEYEVSVIVARSVSGQMVTYGPIANAHHRHILDVSVFPSPADQRTVVEATRIAQHICAELDAVGVICVEFFVRGNGDLLVNEIAPRPHNSGHLTIDACTTCQFEQQVRAICGLSLGASTPHRPAAMANLLGDLWFPAAPNWENMLRFADAKLHLYGKSEARPGRKMGHITALGETPQLAERRVREARQALSVDSHPA